VKGHGFGQWEGLGHGKTMARSEVLKLESEEEDSTGNEVCDVRLGCLSQWGTCFIIDGAASEVSKGRHDVTFPLST
jgi:hypothetical protein